MTHGPLPRTAWYGDLALEVLFHVARVLATLARVLSIGVGGLLIYAFFGAGWYFTRHGPQEIFDHPWSQVSVLYWLQLLWDTICIGIGYLLWLGLGALGVMLWLAVEHFCFFVSDLKFAVARWRNCRRGRSRDAP
jgi:hypothetical protein